MTKPIHLLVQDLAKALVEISKLKSQLQIAVEALEKFDRILVCNDLGEISTKALKQIKGDE